MHIVDEARDERAFLCPESERTDAEKERLAEIDDLRARGYSPAEIVALLSKEPWLGNKLWR